MGIQAVLPNPAGDAESIASLKLNDLSLQHIRNIGRLLEDRIVSSDVLDLLFAPLPQIFGKLLVARQRVGVLLDTGPRPEPLQRVLESIVLERGK